MELVSEPINEELILEYKSSDQLPPLVSEAGLYKRIELLEKARNAMEGRGLSKADQLKEWRKIFPQVSLDLKTEKAWKGKFTLKQIYEKGAVTRTGTFESRGSSSDELLLKPIQIEKSSDYPIPAEHDCSSRHVVLSLWNKVSENRYTRPKVAVSELPKEPESIPTLTVQPEKQVQPKKKGIFNF